MEITHLPIKPLVSVFPCGYMKGDKAVLASVPTKAETTLDKVAEYVRCEKYAGLQTRTLRSITDKEENRQYKALNFRYVTFSGVFPYRNAKSAASVSPYLVLDFDKDDILAAYPGVDIKDALSDLRNKLLSDRNIDTAMEFISPNGTGIKWVIYVGDKQGLTHRQFFDAITAYVSSRYGVKADKSGSDICRPCYLPYDPECYLAPDLNALRPPRINMQAWLDETRKARQSKVQSNAGSVMKPTNGSVFDLVESWIQRDCQYVEGSYNRYVSQCCYTLCKYGVPESETEQWAVSRFDDYDASQVRSIVQSCYRNGEFATHSFRTNG